MGNREGKNSCMCNGVWRENHSSVKDSQIYENGKKNIQNGIDLRDSMRRGSALLGPLAQGFQYVGWIAILPRMRYWLHLYFEDVKIEEHRVMLLELTKLEMRRDFIVLPCARHSLLMEWNKTKIYTVIKALQKIWLLENPLDSWYAGQALVQLWENEVRWLRTRSGAQFLILSRARRTSWGLPVFPHTMFKSICQFSKSFTIQVCYISLK